MSAQPSTAMSGVSGWGGKWLTLSGGCEYQAAEDEGEEVDVDCVLGSEGS